MNWRECDRSRWPDLPNLSLNTSYCTISSYNVTSCGARHNKHRPCCHLANDTDLLTPVLWAMAGDNKQTDLDLPTRLPELTQNLIRSYHGHSTPSLKISCNRSSRFLVMLLTKKQRKKSPKNNTPSPYRGRGNKFWYNCNKFWFVLQKNQNLLQLSMPLVHIFTKYWPISKILSLYHSIGNLIYAIIAIKIKPHLKGVATLLCELKGVWLQ